MDSGKEIEEPMDKEPMICKVVAMVLRYPSDREDKDENPKITGIEVVFPGCLRECVIHTMKKK